MVFECADWVSLATSISQCAEALPILNYLRKLVCSKLQPTKVVKLKWCEYVHRRKFYASISFLSAGISCIKCTYSIRELATTLHQSFQRPERQR